MGENHDKKDFSSFYTFVLLALSMLNIHVSSDSNVQNNNKDNIGEI